MNPPDTTGPARDTVRCPWYRRPRFERYAPLLPTAALAAPAAVGGVLTVMIGPLLGDTPAYTESTPGQQFYAAAIFACLIVLPLIGWFVTSLMVAVALVSADPAGPMPWYRHRSAAAYAMHIVPILVLALTIPVAALAAAVWPFAGLLLYFLGPIILAMVLGLALIVPVTTLAWLIAARARRHTSGTPVTR